MDRCTFSRALIFAGTPAVFPGPLFSFTKVEHSDRSDEGLGSRLQRARLLHVGAFFFTAPLLFGLSLTNFRPCVGFSVDQEYKNIGFESFDRFWHDLQVVIDAARLQVLHTNSTLRDTARLTACAAPHAAAWGCCVPPNSHPLVAGNPRSITWPHHVATWVCLSCSFVARHPCLLVVHPVSMSTDHRRSPLGVWSWPTPYPPPWCSSLCAVPCPADRPPRSSHAAAAQVTGNCAQETFSTRRFTMENPVTSTSQCAALYHTCQLLESWSRDTWYVMWFRLWSRSNHCEGEAFAFLGGPGACSPGKFWKSRRSNEHFFNALVNDSTHLQQEKIGLKICKVSCVQRKMTGEWTF